MRRLRPILVTSTLRTLGGKATGFGNRTAWLRLVLKTVERAILPLPIHGISRRDIRIACRLVNTASLSKGAWFHGPRGDVTGSEPRGPVTQAGF
jgi:hypothetical protein